MSTVKIGTFNAENLFMRYRFDKTVDIEKFKREGGEINTFKLFLESAKPIGTGQIKNTAKVIKENDPDIIALQEVESLDTLKQFNRIRSYLNRAYPYGILIDGNDRRQIDVALLSKYKISNIRTHQYDKDDNGNLIFSRDCIEVDITIGEKTLTFFVNHFKSKYRDNPAKRKRQAERVAEIIKDRFGEQLRGDFVVAGDFNDTPDSDTLKALLGSNSSRLENVVQRMVPTEQWTTEYKGRTSQIDYLLLSPSLAEGNPNEIPYIERRGLGDYIKSYKGPRFKGVGKEGTEASDHCAIFMNINSYSSPDNTSSS
jgi:endonuclease/exonuclease/phosphatase family metal-dependent hydrolase